jgi:uncharacterized Zn-finger protein
MPIERILEILLAIVASDVELRKKGFPPRGNTGIVVYKMYCPTFGGDLFHPKIYV